MKMSREWAMPNGKTFLIPPIGVFLDRWIKSGDVVVDPFARDSKRGTITNDLSPEFSTNYQMDAEDFLTMLFERGVKADVLLFDPPYSPRQISELYQSIGREVGMKGTQNAALYKRVRNAAEKILRKDGVVLSFGWHSNGMGKMRGYQIEELMLVAHGGAHSDTICLAETRRPCLL